MFTIFRTSIFLICRSVCDRSGRTTPSGLYREALRRKCHALYAFVSLKHCLLCESSHCLCCESHYDSCCLHSESCHCQVPSSAYFVSPTIVYFMSSTIVYGCLTIFITNLLLLFRSFLNFHFPS